MMYKPKCENYDITTIGTSSESYLHWKNHFHKNPLYFRIYAGFEADNEIDNSNLGDKINIMYKQNPILNSYHIESELDDILKKGFYKSPLGFDIINWFVDEVLKLETKIASYFKSTKKDITITEEDEEEYRNKNVCRLREKN